MPMIDSCVIGSSSWDWNRKENPFLTCRTYVTLRIISMQSRNPESFSFSKLQSTASTASTALFGVYHSIRIEIACGRLIRIVRQIVVHHFYRTVIGESLIYSTQLIWSSRSRLNFLCFHCCVTVITQLPQQNEHWTHRRTIAHACNAQLMTIIAGIIVECTSTLYDNN